MSEGSGKKTRGEAGRVSDDARTLFAFMLLSGKNLSLYPDDHGISSGAIRQFYQRLQAFHRRHGDFKIDIEKDRVNHQGVDIHSGPFEEGTPTFTLLRDGVKWLEFSQGVTETDVRELLVLFNRYQILAAEPDGDMVTALWEKRFTHIQYEAADIFPGDTKGLSQFHSDLNRVDAAKQYAPEPDRDDRIDPEDLILSPKEQAELQSMVLIEETEDPSSHLYMLLDSLLLYEDEESFRAVLDVLAEEFKHFFAGRDFQACLIILEGIRHIKESGGIGASWAGPAMEAFLAIVSDDGHLQPLEDIWQSLNVKQVGILARILLRLHPKAAGRVALLLSMHKPPQFQIIVEEALLTYLSRDGACLEPLIGSADEKIVGRLIPVVAKADADLATKYLMKLMRHPSGAVRRPAVKAIAQGRKFPAAEIFGLIDDPDEDVRRLILRQLSRERDTIAEYLLLRYLEKNQFSADQTGHILECFKALGRCGSLRSVPYLSKVLFSRKWLSSFQQSPFHLGAALALAALKIPESDQVLETARHSIHLGLRRIVREACRDESLGPKEAR